LPAVRSSSSEVREPRPGRRTGRRPTRTGEIVYTADAYRGVDVLKIESGGLTGKKVKAPVRNEWFASPTADSASFQSHPVYGFVCPVLKPDVDTP
jgi:hypothetical protein